MMMMKTSLLLLFMCVYVIDAETTRFHVIRQWKFLNFTWPSEDVLKTAVANGLYIQDNNIIAGVKYFEDYYYLTLPRMKSGVPVTLARIKAGPGQQASPLLEPYPSWSMNSIDDCNSLQNVQNIEIDYRGKMWIIDNGRTQTLTNPVAKCPPKLIIFDIKLNQSTIVYDFPEDIAPKNGSFLYDIVVDNTDGGYAYITDNSAQDPGIIVYSVKQNRAWKVRHSVSMKADPTVSLFQVNGVSVSAPINIAGIALGPKVHTNNGKVVVNEDREVYFCPLSSLHLYSINTTMLRNLAPNYDTAIKDVGLKPSQTIGMIMDNQGTLYYSLLGNNAIGRWDSHTPFQSGQKIIARDDKYIEWPNSFTFDRAGNLTVVMNRLNRFIFEKIDITEDNFRLISANVGGRSYLDDDGLQYTEPESSPEPSPEPEPSAEPHDHVEVHHVTQSATVSVKQMPSAAGCYAISVSLLMLSAFLLFV